MSSQTQNRPMMTLYPSPKERVDSYMAAIRLASSARNSMDAQKAGVDSEKNAPLADAYGRHHPNVPPHTSAKSATPGGREPDLILNQTASAHFAPNTTKAGFVRSQDGNPSPSRSVSTAVHPNGATLEALKRHQGYFPPPDPPTIAGDDSTAENAVTKREVPKQHNGYFPPPDPSMTTGKDSVPEDTTANAPTGVKPEALEQHNGYFPPPDPPIDATHAGQQVRHRGFTQPATAISTGTDPSMTPLPPNGIPPECQIKVHYTDPATTYTVCPETKRTIINSTDDLASGYLHTEGLSISDILAPRNTAVCEAPTGFDERLACARDSLTVGLVVLFIALFCIVFSLKSRKDGQTGREDYRPRQVDEEAGTPTWTRPAEVSTPDGFELQRKKPRDLNTLTTRTDSSEGTLIEETRSSQGRYRLDEGVGAVQYEPVAWRSRSLRAERALVGGGKVVHDAGPVAALPRLNERSACSHFGPLT